MFIIAGIGEQGRAILRFLANYAGPEKIVTIDLKSKEQLEDDGLKKFSYLHGPDVDWEHISLLQTRRDLLDVVHKKINKERNKHEKIVVIDCLPLKYSLELAIRCIDLDCDYINLGGSLDTTIKIINSINFKKPKNSRIVPDCGLAPGLVSSIVGTLERNSVDNQGVEKLKIYCGGLPENPILPIGYIETFDFDGLLREYGGVVEFRENRRTKILPTFTGKENIFIKGLGVLEALRTSGGLSLTPRRSKFHTVEYKTLRYPGHYDWIRKNVLVPGISQEDRKRILMDNIPPVSSLDRDLIVLHIVNQTFSNLESKSLSCFWKYDRIRNISAMAQATGYVTAAVAIMLDRGMIKQKGYVGMDEIDYYEIKKIIQRSEPGQFLQEL